MELPFTHRPGRRERHLMRKHESPLFAWPPVPVEPAELLAAQQADHEAMDAFRESFQALLQQAVDLPPDADSDTVLGLKESLERHYEESFGLPEDHTRARGAIAQLIEVIGRALDRIAGSDPIARQELAEVAAARAIHFRLLESPLVGDLLDPQTPITPEELVPVLLGAPLAELEAALELLDPEHCAQLATDAARLVDALEARGVDGAPARQRMALILERLPPHLHPHH